MSNVKSVCLLYLPDKNQIEIILASCRFTGTLDTTTTAINIQLIIGYLSKLDQDREKTKYVEQYFGWFQVVEVGLR